ncbi:hypothetical protein, conserved [Eimeria brunetti]|uniref:Thrombospondin type 1 domain-containing protein n=1 Tax=Eimeria brunetti TaxID=51314 RepID=U6LG07_9EIME|nr:hypothetical protein, conserved [Eimeria brunetti]
MVQILIHQEILEGVCSKDAACGKQRSARWKLSLSSNFLNYVRHRVFSSFFYFGIASNVQHMPIMGFGRSRSGRPVRRHEVSYMNLIVTAVVILACACKAVTGLAIDGDQAGESRGEPASGGTALLFAEPLHGDDITFVEARLKAAFSAGTPPSQMAVVAAEAASLVSWSECSRFCNGGSQTADSEQALKLAVEGLRRVLSSSGEWSDSYVQEVGNLVDQFTMDGGPAARQAKTRPCNTFKCPFEVPTDLKTANLHIAREPAVVASFGVIPQVEFTETCKDRLMLDQIDHTVWTARRNEHLRYRRMQERAGEVPGWEATVFAPEQLSLYSCVALCRLHHRCNALIYTKDIDAMQTEEGATASDGPKGGALNALENAVAIAGSVVNRLDENLAKLSAPVAETPSEPQNGNPVCTLYTGVKVSLVSDCGIEPTQTAENGTLTLLVMNLDIDFNDIARVMRASMAQQLSTMNNVLRDANTLLARTNIRNLKGSSVQQRAEWLTARVTKASHRAQLASHIFPQAVRVIEAAAVDATKALRSLQSQGESAAHAQGFGSGEDMNPVRPADDERQALYSSVPLSTSCSVFSGVELLNRGCVQLPALQTHSTMLASTSSVDATEGQQAPEEPSSMTWQNCQEVLKDVAKHLDNYRTAISRIKVSGSEATDAAKEAERLLPLVLGLSPEQTAKLSLPDISDRLQAETGLMNQDFAKFLDEKNALELRREVVTRLGEEAGTILAVFDTARHVCEIRAVFEPRYAESGSTLGAQFPSACASFSPFSLMFLLSESSGSGRTDPGAGGPNNNVGMCEDISCTYSPWTSWSPCDDSYQLENEKDGGIRSAAEVESDGAGHSEPAMWQLRVKERLARPKVALQCDNFLEARLCKDRATAATEASGLMDGFTAAISKSISSWCIYSPYSEWSECEPKCVSGDTAGLTAYQTRTRTVHQYPVPGLASRCDTASLEMQRTCGAVPKCSNRDAEEDGVDDAPGGRVRKEGYRGNYTAPSAIHVHSQTSMLNAEAPASGRVPLNALVRRVLQSRTARKSGPEYYEAQNVRYDDSYTAPREALGRSFVAEADFTDSPTSEEIVGQHLVDSAVAERTEGEPEATAEDFIVSEGEGSQEPDGDLPPVVTADTEDANKLNIPHEGSVVEPLIENDETENLTVEGDTGSTPPAENESTPDPSAMAQPQEDQVTIPYDSPFIEDTAAQKPVGDGTVLAPIVEENDHESPVVAQEHDEPLTIPYDTPLSDNDPDSFPGTSNNAPGAMEEVPAYGEPTVEGVVEPTEHPAEGNATDTESFFLGLSFFSFVGCCLFGALASAVLVLITVVCSRRIRSWLGYDWSGATEEERMALLKKQANPRGLASAAPLINPDGIQVMSPDGAPLLASRCLNHSGGQYVTHDGSQIYVTVGGNFVNSWGEPIHANELPRELLAKVDKAKPSEPVRSRPLPGTIRAQGQTNGKPSSGVPPTKELCTPQQAAKTQGKRVPLVGPPKKIGPVPKQVAEARRSSAASRVKAKGPGLPPPKAPGRG